MNKTIEQCSYWLASRTDYQVSSPPNQDISADVAIVGAGFTGLWTAYFLKKLDPNLDVVVVEQQVVGYGGSGRNAGIVSACIDHSHALAISHFGREDAERLAKIGLNNIDELAEFASDCDYEKTGQLHVALTEAQMEDCRSSAEVASSMGIGGHKFLNAEETRAELNSPLYLGAAWVPGGGIVNPVKLADKIKRECESMGVRFFERSRVESIGKGEIRTAGAKISAPKIVLATDSYTHHLVPQLLWRFIPLYDYIVVSEPLSQSQLDLIGWKNRQGVTDGRTFFNYYRLTADNRILWGTSEAMYYAPNRVDESCDHSEAHYADLDVSFKRHFPQLKDLQFPFKWGGPIASTTRLTPFFGTIHDGAVIYGLGYTGHGIGSTRVSGKVMAHMATARPSELLELEMVKKKPFPYPPEPIRGMAVRAVTDSLRKVDKGESPNILLKALDIFGIGFSS